MKENQKLKKSRTAVFSILAALLIAVTTLPATVTADEWTKTDKGYVYTYDNGTTAKTGWLTVGKDKYYINKDGLRHTGWLKTKTATYYFNKNGKMVTGKCEINKKSYTFGKDGKMVKVERYDITYKKAKVYTNSIGTVRVQTIIEVTNTGDFDLYLSSGAYDLEDSEGNLVTSRDYVSVYPQVISPGEKAYYYEERAIDGVSKNDKLTVVPRVDIKKAKVSNVKYKVTDGKLKYDSTYGRLKMMGRIENKTKETASMVYIACVLYDADKKPIGLIYDIKTEDIAPGAKIGFEGTGLSLPSDVAENYKSYSFFAYPVQYQFN